METTTQSKSLSSIEQVSRWLALIEAVNHVYTFADSKEIDNVDLKPSAINRYVDERVATISKDLELETMEEDTKMMVSVLQP